MNRQPILDSLKAVAASSSSTAPGKAKFSGEIGRFLVAAVLGLIGMVSLATASAAQDNALDGTEHEVYLECMISIRSDIKCSCVVSVSKSVGDDNIVGRTTFATIYRQNAYLTLLARTAESSVYYGSKSDIPLSNRGAAFFKALGKFGNDINASCRVDVRAIVKSLEPK